jgi:hypothetical protein
VSECECVCVCVCVCERVNEHNERYARRRRHNEYQCIRLFRVHTTEDTSDDSKKRYTSSVGRQIEMYKERWIERCTEIEK